MKLLARIILLLAMATSVAAQGPPAPQFDIRRVAHAITVDGVVSPEEWREATPVEKWFEISPGNNIEPKVRTTGYLAYDAHFLYAAMVCHDPRPSEIRAPYTDRDNLSDATDYVAVILNPSGDRKTGIEFIANPRGIQGDAINSDAAGEDSAPDFYWDSAGRINSDGWSVEIRIPWSSLRYPPAEEQHWNMLMFRNYPRDRRYQIASVPIEQGASCTMCKMAPVVGLRDLPSASHLILAPYTTLHRDSVPEAGPGSPLRAESVDSRFGMDMKWTPNAHVAVDATINPDFSQVESDVAAITANERFAVFFPEKRPFFLEGKDLFSTPIQAVYTREINEPRWGARSTGTIGSTAYTVLVADDRGGGAVIISGPNNSHFATADFQSRNLIGRVRHDIGGSFASFLVTDREIEGGGHNRVFGPDFLWRITPDDYITGQFLVSDSATPQRPDLDAEWNGQSFTSHAAQVEWHHSTRRFDWFINGIDRGDKFRADLGFVPQVGTREAFGRGGYTIRPTRGFFSSIRPEVTADYTGQRDGSLVYRFIAPGVEFEGRWASYGSVSVAFDRVRAGQQTIRRTQAHFEIGAHPSRVLQQIGIEGQWGTDIDFANSRPGRGGKIEFGSTIRPSDHLELVLNSEYGLLNLRNGQRLFAARVERLKATYNFSSRSFLRLVGQHVRTDRGVALYVPPLDDTLAAEAGRTLSLLYAYKLNWQTVLYVGYGDERELLDRRSFAPSSRTAFVKVSYAWQK